MCACQLMTFLAFVCLSMMHPGSAALMAKTELLDEDGSAASSSKNAKTELLDEDECGAALQGCTSDLYLEESSDSDYLESAAGYLLDDGVGGGRLDDAVAAKGEPLDDGVGGPSPKKPKLLIGQVHFADIDSVGDSAVEGQPDFDVEKDIKFVDNVYGMGVTTCNHGELRRTNHVKQMVVRLGLSPLKQPKKCVPALHLWMVMHWMVQ